MLVFFAGARFSFKQLTFRFVEGGTIISWVFLPLVLLSIVLGYYVEVLLIGEGSGF
jgi:hypothetical protein